MAKRQPAPKTSDDPAPRAFAALYPHIARWVAEEEGWVEIGQTERSFSLVRAVYGGGMAWEGQARSADLDEALRALDAGIAAWLGEHRPWAVGRDKPLRRPRKKT